MNTAKGCDYMKLENGIKVIKKLKENGYLCFFVGGVVRDYILNLEYNDIDLTTNAKSSEIIKLFDKEVLRENNYGSLTLLINNEEIEITTFRKDLEYLDYRHPEYVYTKNIEDDVFRRDFTINALLMDENYKILDYVEGLKDLDNKLIKAINDPFIKFFEDALRILRAIHFKAKLNFKIEENTLSAMIYYKDNLTKISKDMILREIKKILNDTYFYEAIDDFLLIADSLNLKNTLEIIKKKGIRHVSFTEFFLIAYYYNQEIDFNLPKTVKKIIEVAYELSKIMYKESYNKLIIYSYQEEVCLLANKLNYIVNDDFNKEEEIIKLAKQIPIKKTCDLKFKGTEIINELHVTEVSKISAIIDDIKYNVVMGILANEYEVLKSYAFKKYGGKYEK